MNQGVVYIATREQYLDEAITSGESVHDQHHNLPITLFTDLKTEHPGFDSIQPVRFANHDFSDSNLGGEHFPYDRTLFLDSDTYICGDISPIFDCLDRFEIVAAHDPTRMGTCGHTHEHSVPDTFPQYNTGVIAYRDTPKVRDLFNRWDELYYSVDGVVSGLNQPTFRMAAYESDVDIGTLPPEYNFRMGVNSNCLNYACGPVKILHGRSVYWKLDELAEYVNSSEDMRTVNCKSWPPEVTTHSDQTPGQWVSGMLDQAQWKLYKDGFTGLARAFGVMVRSKIS